METFDVCWAKFPWRGEHKRRPWLLVRVDREDPRYWLCLAISTKDYDSAPFEVASDDPDFGSTGLTETSYIYDADPIAVLELMRELHHDPARRLRVVSGSASGLCGVRDADAGRSTAE